MKRNPRLDEEEKAILRDYRNSIYVSKEEDLEKYRKAAEATFNKTKRINFRVTESDFAGVQIRARQEGIPYQTLVSSIVHKYLSGRLKEV